MQAFIGYKDHNDGNERILLHKFVDKEGISSLEQYVAKIVANGGADGPEDIAGALQVPKASSALFVLAVAMSTNHHISHACHASLISCQQSMSLCCRQFWTY